MLAVGISTDYGTQGSEVDGQAHHNIDGLSEAAYCRRGGDSGGPVFASHRAYGTHSGGSAVCDALFYPILYAEADLNVTVATGT
ncbi:trypsin-like serine protease [Nakamurella lactea]|uniref:trypsin-like serine protease n=1 Tax=Nakamurella lactea TaxID=459515 RepID=UPI003898EBE4